MPFVRNVAGVIRSEFTFEWPNWVGLSVSILVIVGETLKTHVSDVLTNLCELCVGGHQVALISWKVNMSVVLMMEETVGVRVTFESVQRERISRVNSISQEF